MLCFPLIFNKFIVRTPKIGCRKLIGLSILSSNEYQIRVEEVDSGIISWQREADVGGPRIGPLVTVQTPFYLILFNATNRLSKGRIENWFPHLAMKTLHDPGKSSL